MTFVNILLAAALLGTIAAYVTYLISSIRSVLRSASMSDAIFICSASLFIFSMTLCLISLAIKLLNLG